MYTLDSRFISLGECFAHRFSTPGTFAYALSPLPSSLVTHEGEPTERAIVVTAASGKDQHQHTITVSQTDGILTAQPSHLEIAAGDLVVWTADRSATFGFRVRGTIGDDVVDSASLRTESIFTHAFGLPGTYEWVDANGSDLRGLIEVSMPDATQDPDSWLAHLTEGTLVHVKGHRAKPENVNIVVGQTVVWAVEDAPGVTVTDATLIDLDAGQTPVTPS